MLSVDIEVNNRKRYNENSVPSLLSIKARGIV